MHVGSEPHQHQVYSTPACACSAFAGIWKADSITCDDLGSAADVANIICRQSTRSELANSGGANVSPTSQSACFCIDHISILRLMERGGVASCQPAKILSKGSKPQPTKSAGQDP